MSFQGPIIFVDESGDPGLNLQRSRCRYFTIGFVYTPSPGILRKKLRRVLKRAHLRGKYPPQTGELKFYLPETDLIQKGLSKKDIARFRAQMPDLRKKSIDAITSSQAQTFVAVVDKSKAQGWKSQEELYNFAFAQTLLVNVMNVISPLSNTKVSSNTEVRWEYLITSHRTPKPASGLQTYLQEHSTTSMRTKIQHTHDYSQARRLAADSVCIGKVKKNGRTLSSPVRAGTPLAQSGHGFLRTYSSSLD